MERSKWSTQQMSHRYRVFLLPIKEMNFGICSEAFSSPSTGLWTSDREEQEDQLGLEDRSRFYCPSFHQTVFSLYTESRTVLPEELAPMCSRQILARALASTCTRP